LAGGAAAISPPAISAAPRLAMKAAISNGNVILNAGIASPLDYCGSIIASRRGWHTDFAGPGPIKARFDRLAGVPQPVVSK
jgi:hypothetical protein